MLPLTKPKIIAKVMSIAVESPAGSHNARHVTIHNPILKIKVFILPIMSATSPAKKRPKNDPAFKIAIIWKPNEELCPWDVA